MSDLRHVSEILVGLLPQAAESKRQSSRRRLSAIHRGAHAAIDSAVEARRDTEHVATENETRRADVQDLFSHNTRRLVRKLESRVRELEREISEYRRAA